MFHLTYNYLKSDSHQKNCFIFSQNFILWLLLLLEILGSKCITIVCFSCCGVINLEMNLSNLAVFLLDQKAKKKKN